MQATTLYRKETGEAVKGWRADVDGVVVFLCKDSGLGRFPWRASHYPTGCSLGPYAYGENRSEAVEKARENMRRCSLSTLQLIRATKRMPNEWYVESLNG